MKICTIIGARPQFIKHAPMQLELQKYFTAITIHTGQHYDSNMSNIFFNELKIPRPEYHLQLDGKTHGHQTGEMMTKIEEIVLDEKPDVLLVYGDTNSTLAGALVGAKLHIPVVHIEAGLRSFNKDMPEEINRIVTDHVADLLICPSTTAIENLKKEGIDKNVYLSGDVMKDMLNISLPFLQRKTGENRYYFATLHRPYNTDSAARMKAILDSFQQMNHRVIFAMHPRTSNLIRQYDISLADYPNVEVIEPVGYFDSISYQNFAEAVVTDSGGMQKEAYWLKKKCVTLRKETEWTETLKDDHNKLLFEDLSVLPDIIDRKISVDFDDTLYGNGNSAEQIAELIKQRYA